ncbi:MAG: hypothetical protein WC455_14690 [Dehalococcoidia bacterium]|jgi:hypothetical protein
MSGMTDQILADMRVENLKLRAQREVLRGALEEALTKWEELHPMVYWGETHPLFLSLRDKLQVTLTATKEER